jgi:integrase
LIRESEFFKLVQLANFERHGRPNHLAYRSRAAAVLAYCGGLRFTEIAVLELKHWMPDGQSCIVVSSNLRRSPRRVPASPATRWAVERYLTERGPVPGRLLFDAEGGLPLKLEILNALRTAGFLKTRRAARAHDEAAVQDVRQCRPAGGDRIRPGDLRASFEDAIISSAPEDPRSYYLVGLQPPGGLPDLIDHPRLSDLDRLLKKSGHLYEDVQELWKYTAEE